MLSSKGQDLIKFVSDYVDSSERIIGERREELSKQASEINQLQDQVAKLKSDKALFEKRNNKLREINEKLQARVKTLEDEVNRLKETNKQLEQAMSASKQSTRVLTKSDLEAQMEEDGIADENEGLAARSPDEYENDSDSSDCVVLVNDVKIKEEAGQCMDVKTETKPPTSDALALMSTGAARCKTAAAAAGAGLETDSDSETDTGATGAASSVAVAAPVVANGGASACMSAPIANDFTMGCLLTQQNIDMVCKRMLAVPSWSTFIHQNSVNVTQAVQYYKTNLADLSPCKPILDSVDALAKELVAPIKKQISILRDRGHDWDGSKDFHRLVSGRITSITSCFKRIIERVGNADEFEQAILNTQKTAEQLSRFDPDAETMEQAKTLVQKFFICKISFRDNAVDDFRTIHTLLKKLSEDAKKKVKDLREEFQKPKKRSHGEPSNASRDTKKRPRDEALDAEGGNGAAASP